MGDGRAIRRAGRRAIIDDGGDDSGDVRTGDCMGNIWAIVEPS